MARKFFLGDLTYARGVISTIDTNAGLPNGRGTTTWDIERETTTPGQYAVSAPADKGWGGLTKAELMVGLEGETLHTDVTFPEPEE